HVGIEVVRGFPITAPRQGISLLDAEGRELLWIENLDELDAPFREVLEQELPRREFMPQVRRILQVLGAVEPTESEVETDRGLARFVLNSEDDIRRLGEDRALILDAHGIRYFIPSLAALDGRSRRLLERYL